MYLHNKYKGQGAETDAQQVPPQYEEELLYHMRVTMHWKQVAQRGCGVPLTGFKNHLDMILCIVLWDDPA